MPLANKTSEREFNKSNNPPLRAIKTGRSSGLSLFLKKFTCQKLYKTISLSENNLQYS